MQSNSDLESVSAHPGVSTSPWQHVGQTTTAIGDSDVLQAEAVLQQLFAGSLQLEQRFTTASHAYGVLRVVDSNEPRRPLTPAWVAIFERFLLGDSQKAIALDVSLSQATVASIVFQCKERLGIRGRAAAAPLLLVLIAHAARLHGAPIRPCWGREVGALQTLHAPRPETLLASALPQLLTDAEFDVLRLLVDGNSPAAICAARRSRPRTVANQLSSVYTKLRTSGRMSVLRRLQTLVQGAPQVPPGVAAIPWFLAGKRASDTT